MMMDSELMSQMKVALTIVLVREDFDDVGALLEEH
jgi:hypothetical protein